MAARSVKVLFRNYSNKKLIKIDEGLDHGIWVSTPPNSIDPTQTADWKSESAGFMTGTEGWVIYRPEGVGKDIRLHWDNPFVGSNSYDESAPPGYLVGHAGGDGNDAEVEFRIFQTSQDSGAEAITNDTLIKSLRVWIATADERLAGTDNSVYLNLGPLGWRLGRSHYNDFERGASDVYQLSLPTGISLKVGDLVRIRLEKKGIFGYRKAPDGIDGAWKPRGLSLIVNQQEYKSFDINQWLNRDHPEWEAGLIQTRNRGDWFARSLRISINEELSFFDKQIAKYTTLFKRFGISGWTDLHFAAFATGIVKRTARSTDTIGTIDMQVESVVIDDEEFVLDGAHGINHTRYLRAEYWGGGSWPAGFLPYWSPLDIPIPLGTLPEPGQRVRIFGEVLWDSDDEGWLEIHPIRPEDIVSL